MIFEKIRKEDHDEFIAMENEFYHSSAVLHSIPEENFERTFGLLMASSPFADCIVFRDGETVCGYALLALTYSNEAGGTVVWIEEIYVKPQYRGKGIGGAFFEYIDNEYKGVARTRLEICPDNIKAAALYKRNGFAELGYLQMYKDN